MTDALKASLIRFEGRVLHMYLDSLGNVTCGVGHLLRTADDALKLRFTEVGGAILSAQSSITAEYLRVKFMEPNRVASYYAQRTNLRLSEADMDALLDQDIAAMERSLAASVGGFTRFPDPAQDALMDMAFNLGVSGLHKYYKLLSACDSGSWAVAASECHRKGISEDRNNATAELFRGLVVA